MKTKISVVVPTFNEEARIETCLNKILDQIEKPFEIIVVDNNSTDKTAKIAQKMGAKIVKETVQGRRAARDAGFNAATGDIIARTDADTLVPTDWTKKIRKAFEKDWDLLGYSGSGHFYGFPSFLQFNNWLATGSSRFVKTTMKHDGMMGFNLAIKKQAWDLIKNEVCLEDKIVHEDMDLAIHIARHGKVKFDKSLVVHTSSRQIRNLKVLIEYIFRGFKTAAYHRSKKH
jgi:glycosyltransferase involved in cell wall biosynthesis